MASTPATDLCRWRRRSTMRWVGSRRTWKDGPACADSGRWERSPPPASTAPTASPRTHCSRVWSSPIGRAVRHGCDPDRRSSCRLPDVPPLHDDGADAECEGIRREMRSVMTADVGVQRTESSLLHAEQELERLALETPAGAGAPPTSSWSRGSLPRRRGSAARAAEAIAEPIIRRPPSTSRRDRAHGASVALPVIEQLQPSPSEIASASE